MSDWWTRFVDTAPDWYRNFDASAIPDWWRIPGADAYGPTLNVGIGFQAIGDTFQVGDLPVGDAAVSTTFYVG